MIIESLLEIINSGEIWSIVIKALLTIVLSGFATLIGTIIVKTITRHKESKIYKYADTLIEAAEQKYPNEGIKMGPQKMDYVMSQLCIKFPHIKDNRYLYNVAEQAVFKFNENRNKQKEIEQFESKHGKGSFIIEKKYKRRRGKNRKNKNTTSSSINNSVGGTVKNTTTSGGNGLKSF